MSRLLSHDFQADFSSFTTRVAMQPTNATPGAKPSQSRILRQSGVDDIRRPSAQPSEYLDPILRCLPARCRPPNSLSNGQRISIVSEKPRGVSCALALLRRDHISRITPAILCDGA
jgi:hypothetical protein